MRATPLGLGATTTPDYRLEECHRATPMFQQVEPVPLWRSLKSLSFRLWDEQRRQLVGFGQLKTVRRGSVFTSRPVGWIRTE
jgi:hypothetical protein